MSSLARRGLRTTVAAAGLAALGAGFATPALAAPALPDAPAAPDLTSAPSLPADLPAAPSSLDDLPPVFTFDMPQVNTATPSAYSLPDASHAANADNSVNGMRTPSTDPSAYSMAEGTAAGAQVARAAMDHASALQQLDGSNSLWSAAMSGDGSGPAAGHDVSI